MADTSNSLSDFERGRLAAAAVKANGGDAMAQTLAWIETAFDETARQNSLRERAERLRKLQLCACGRGWKKRR